ncbi:MAG: hypothetical protein IJ217_05150 [Clostridia bacterium]|nr:hypothetical protein [Clostridia bacterium]
MGIGLKDIMKDDKSSLVEDKQKRTIKRLIFVALVLVVLVFIVVGMIISNQAKARRATRVHSIATDVANISNVVKNIGQQYITNNYSGVLPGTSLDNYPIEINVNGKRVEYRYGYYLLTPEEVAELITSLNVKGESYIVNYMNGDVVNRNGVKANDGKTYYSLEDIVAVDAGSTPKNIIYIHNEKEMELLRSNPSATFYLSNNIDMGAYASGEGWEPVASFSGTFDGRNYTISNLTINRPTSTYSGLFGQVTSKAVIKDVKFEKVNVRGGNYTGALAGSCSTNIENIKITDGNVDSTAEHVGALVGAFDAGTITDCVVENVYVSAYGSVGGLIGTLNSGTVTRSSASGRVVGTSAVGGLIGDVRPSSATNITEVFSNVSITGQNNVGGLIGDVQIFSASPFKLNDSYSEGAIGAGRENVGGSIGNIYTANSSELDVQSVYTATDTPTVATVRGGFVGRTDIEEGTNVQVLKCVFEKDPLLDLNVPDIGQKVGGVSIVFDSKTPAEMRNRVTYSDWNFDLWTLDEGISRPHLRWEFENRAPQIAE